VNDFERLLRDSLRSAGEHYAPSDPSAARERFLARRRRRRLSLAAAGAGLAGATAAVAFFIFTPGTDVREPQRTPPAATADEVKITATIDTGSEPSGVAVGAGYVWVTNGGSDSVSQIDPATNEVVASFEVQGGPDDVAVADDFVWVTTERGGLWRLGPDADAFEKEPPVAEEGGHLDIAAEGSDVFVQADRGPLLVLDEAGNAPQPFQTVGEATDVAVHGDLVWVYERSEGRVVRFDRATRERLGATPVSDSESQDLAATEDFAWFFRGDDATLIQISAEDGSLVDEVPLKGTFGAISPAPDGVWVMTTSGGERGTGEGNLYRVGSDGAEKIDTPVPLGGLPYDVAAGSEGIWVTNHAAGTVTRIDVGPADPAEPEEGAEVIFYYSAGGDILAYRADGTSESVAATGAEETNPALSPSGKTLVYQKVPPTGGPAQIMLLALDDEFYDAGTHERLFDGEWPALSPSGELAWVEPGESVTPTRIGIGTIASEPRAELALSPDDRPVATVTRLAWSASGEELLYEAEIEDHISYSIDVPSSSESPEPEPIPGEEPGEVFVSPAAHSEVGTTLVRLCCGSYPEWEFTIAELGVLTADGFDKLMGLDDLGLQPGFSMFAAPAGTLEYEGTDGWRDGSTPTWLVGDGERLFVVNNTREPDIVGLEGVTGLAVVPGALSSD
jgi:YVTN family beta-propeller protein